MRQRTAHKLQMSACILEMYDHYVISVSRALCMGCESYCWVFVIMWFPRKPNEKVVLFTYRSP